MSLSRQPHLTRRALLVAGGSGASAAVAFSATGRLAFGASDLSAGRAFALGCCAVRETATNGEGRVFDVSQGVGDLTRVGGDTAIFAVEAFRPARSGPDRSDDLDAARLGDFANSRLSVLSAAPSGAGRKVTVWGAESEFAVSVGGELRMELAIPRAEALPVALEFERAPSPLTRRLRAAAAGAPVEAGVDAPIRLSHLIELPLRAGIYFLAGRKVSTDRLPEWSDCRVRTSPTSGDLHLETRGLGSPRPVDFPYLVLRIGHAATPQSIALI